MRAPIPWSGKVERGQGTQQAIKKKNEGKIDERGKKHRTARSPMTLNATKRRTRRAQSRTHCYYSKYIITISSTINSSSTNSSTSSSTNSSQRTRLSHAWLASPAMGLTVLGLTPCPQSAIGSAHELLLVVTDWCRRGTHVVASRTCYQLPVSAF